jgi:putative membrane protein
LHDGRAETHKEGLHMTFGKSFGLAFVLTVVACGGENNQQQAKSPEMTTTTAATDNTSSTTSNDTSSTNGSMNQMPQNNVQQNQSSMTTPQPTAPQLTDSQIAAITDAANKGEIDQAKLALHKAKDPQVKAFAQMMIDHHGTEQKKEQQLCSTLNLQPETTQTSTQLQTDSQNAISSLTSQTGADFDKAYIDLQVKEHRDVLDSIDNKLIPNAKNAQLKQALEAFRPKVQEHLQKAQEIQQKLGTTK